MIIVFIVVSVFVCPYIILELMFYSLKKSVEKERGFNETI